MKWFSKLKIRTKIIASFSTISILTALLSCQGIHGTTLFVCAVLLSLVLGIPASNSICRPVKRLAELAGQAASGEIDEPIETDTKDEIGELAISFSKIIQHQNELAQAVMRISRGDLDVKIVPRSDRDTLSRGMQLCINNIQSLDEELVRLSNAAKNGNLSKRARANNFQGAYAILVRGINEMLDELIRPVRKAIKVMDAIGKRDLTVRLVGDYKGDFATLQNCLNLTADTLDRALGQVALAAEQVASASSQISTGSQMLSQGSSEQAGAIQEVSGSLQEVESVTRQNTENARETRKLSKAAEAAADTGVDSMRRLSEAVDQIKTSSGSTARIIKTIDEIAFQTNLLALNAAVEAARAGDAGRGFAVVAEEVRNLAMRSAEAAKNTADLIEQSVRSSENGVALNREVLKNLSDISEQVKKVGSVMAEIAVASEQQNQGVMQVNNVIHQMSMVTQQIALNAEESASGAEELSGQADELKNMVFAFRLSGGKGTVNPAEIARAGFPERTTTKTAPAGSRSRSTDFDAAEMVPSGDAEPAELGEF